ncbi:hypothetical protein C8Q75DRAFT_772918 [Abortiporus biennis]|nr:hypothetical protein C8Q75DRAFT_772918 [Abortiporus biennis]
MMVDVTTNGNKLRKQPPAHRNSSMSQPISAHQSAYQSRTMMFAKETIPPPVNLKRQLVNVTPQSVETATPTVPPASMTSTEQYWASRAWTAETLLTATATYHQELRSMTEAEKAKRAEEIAALQKQHEVKQSKLERLALLLLTWLISLVAVILYLVVRGHHSPLQQSKWTSPVHFTIPVLSPFTSVVEHEVSAFNARVLSVFAVMGTFLAYMCFRHWMRKS